MKIIRGREHFSSEETLRELQLLILEKRRFWGHLIAAFQHPKEAYKKDGEELVERVCRTR